MTNSCTVYRERWCPGAITIELFDVRMFFNVAINLSAFYGSVAMKCRKQPELMQHLVHKLSVSLRNRHADDMESHTYLQSFSHTFVKDAESKDFLLLCTVFY